LPAIAAARVEGFLVEEMAAPGTELVIGALRDPQFGPMVMVGLGGIFVEILEDVAFRICPVTAREAEEMLGSLRGARLLDGARGRDPVDRAALVQALLAIGGADGLMLRHPEIAEIDVNPVIARRDGLTAVDARIILGVPAAPAAQPRPAAPPGWLDPLFAPRSIAVYGASGSSTTIANTFIRRVRDFGFPGTIYPIHPSAAEIEGLPAYPDLRQLPEDVDYAYIAIGAQNIPAVLEQAGGRMKFAQVISSGFAETDGGEALQRRLMESARRGGARVLGPNCLGLYSPRGGVTFPVGAPRELGSVGVISQSGGLGTDIVKRGQWRGLRFSGLVTIGNSADVSPIDLLRFFFADPATRVIGMYIEDIKDGRAFFDLLRSREATKPVVILRGGRSEHGRAAAASHTGALAGGERLWDALAQQAVCATVETVDQFIDALLALQYFDLRPERPTQDVVLFGNGGGTSVLGTDYFAGRGLRVAPFAPAARERLEALKLPPGTSVANPIDAPVRTLQEQEGRVANEILDLVYSHAAVDAVVMHLNLAAFVGRGGVDPIDNLFQAAVSIRQRYPGRAHFAVVLRSDGSGELDDRKRTYRERALAAEIPAFDEIAPAAEALRAVRHLEVQLSHRRNA
ncbi:MAG TPA: acetate--CoA ligase family protein, partial [Acetobacteraceae bacterium]|nr:acetate--CoA ligase family protein [Acetobacteraceae bacterium]